MCKLFYSKHEFFLKLIVFLLVVWCGMAETSLKLTVNGTDYTGWKSIDVSRSISDVSAAFSLEMTDIVRGFDLPLIRAGDSCKITIQSDGGQEFTILTGFIDSVEANLENDGVSFSIQGRDKAADLVDCSIIGKSEWRSIKFEKFVAEALEPFGMTAGLDAAIDSGDKIDAIKYDQGTSVIEVIAKYAQLKQLLVYSLEDGTLFITRVGTETSDVAFSEGLNVLSASSSSDWSEVFSKYQVKGSRASTKDDSTEKEATQIKHDTDDNRMSRYRPLMIIPDSEQKNVSAKARAEWEATTRIAKAEGHTVTVQGWLIALNVLAALELPSFGVSGNYLIESYRIVADNEGKRTEFNLVHPRSYDPLPTGSIEKDDKDSKLNNAT